MKGKFNLILLVIVFPVSILLSQQQSILSISAEADTLFSQLEDDPGNINLRTRLIEEYIHNSKYELALVEIIELENEQVLSEKMQSLKADCLFNLEQIQPALKELMVSYLRAPDDKIMQSVAIADFALGNETRSVRTLRSLKPKNPELAFDIALLYQQLFLNQNKQLANAASSLLREFDSKEYAKYFPKPQIMIVSPADNYSTQNNEATIVFEVNHSKAIKKISVNESVIYNPTEEEIDLDAESFSKTFNSKMPVDAGKNKIVVNAVDVFGYESSEEIFVNGLNFTKMSTDLSLYSDSLIHNLDVITSFVDTEDIQVTKNPQTKVLVYSFSPGGLSINYNEKGIFWYDFFANQLIGKASPSHTKLLVGKRASSENVNLLVSNWLVPELNVLTHTVLYINGEWELINDRWMLGSSDDELIDLQKHLSSLLTAASSGISLILDGEISSRNRLENDIKNFISYTSIPVEAFITSSNNTLVEDVIQKFSKPDLSNNDSTLLYLELNSLKKIDSLGVYFSNRDLNLEVAENPAVKLSASLPVLKNNVEIKLKKDRMSSSNRSTILNYCSDWRRFEDMHDYLDDRTTASDLLIKAQEFFSRNKENE
ncbi:MAG: hypothetical protein K9J16_16070 [Melioribacteraceae bacterium]|nr:hypothetical protein [Melioribacteraceae bacterium]MCF8356150.1 hypothetical protein [Melioribacteraceae bacterium]MCF8395620.1 hypothetical protein [Melioribacteraceae bacterium]MCF8420871.1 hypothetical protein [Melioribacteraceae bacterium]